jgi:ABC-type microcin C transport system duplicated ATPase subunit YejF
VNGSIHFNGRDLLKLTQKELRQVRGNEIGMIFQDPMTSLNPVLSIREQLTEALRLHKKMNRETALARALELMTMVGIPAPQDRINQYPHQFSGGMRQRVMIG